MHIAIIGAGIVGAAAAALLAKKGHRISIFDAQNPAEKTSFANGGHLSEGDAQSWITPQSLFKIAARNLLPNPAIKIRPALNPDIFRFLSHALIRIHKNQNMILTKMAQRNMELIREKNLAQKPTHHQSEGILHIFSSHAAMRRALKRRERIRSQDPQALPAECLTPQQCAARAPGLRTDHLIGGILFPKDATGDAFLYAKRLIKEAEEEGATLFASSPVLRLEIEKDRVSSLIFQSPQENRHEEKCHADIFVLALGPDTAPFLWKETQIRLPIFPVAGYSATLPIIADAPSIGITDPEARIVTCRLGDHLRVAGLADIMQHRPTPEPHRMKALLLFLKKNLPFAVDFSQIAFWRGMRPMTPDALPFLGKIAAARNLYINAGHGHLGWTTALTSAELLAKLIESHESHESHPRSPDPLQDPLLSALNPERFS